MRQAPDSGWDELWAAAPLTGREPVLGRLRLRLRHGPRGGWVGVSGPHGAGVSRVLAEAAALLAAEPGARAPLVVTPCEPGAARYEPLRRALLPWWRSASDEALRAALAPVVPAVGGGAASLLAWLAAGPLAAGSCVPPFAVLKAALAALTEGGLLIADDWETLGAESRRLLLDLSQGSTTVLAGVAHDGPTAPPTPGSTWPLEPLAEAQVELLLRRWLHGAVAARRLAPEVWRRSEGWPGRVVAIVRGLAAGGALERSPRGISVASWPKTWTPAPDDASALLRRWKARGAATWRVVETAALATEPCEPDLLAEAAGVKRALVERLLAEAAGARGGRSAGCLLAGRALRDLIRERLTLSRRTQAGLRWLRALSRRDPATDRGLGLALARLEVEVQAPEAATVPETLLQALARLPRLPTPAGPVLDLLERAAARVGAAAMPGSAPGLLDVAERLGEAGRVGAAGAVLDAVARVAAAPSEERASLALRLRFGAGPARPEVRDRLLALLRPPPRSDVTTRAEPAPQADPAQHGAWRALAEDPLAAPAEVRLAWRAAVACLAPCDLVARAGVHVRLAEAAARRGALRAACAHGRRAAALLEAQGRAAEAAARWTEVGLREGSAGRWRAAESAFAAAVRSWQALGEPAVEGPTLEAQAHACARLAAHDEAVVLLERSLACSEAAGQTERRAGLHLALARAHRARGDVGGERRHAAQALEHAATTETRLAARATWLLAEVRAGSPGAVADLARVADDLDALSMPAAAAEARGALVDARLRAGAVGEAEHFACAGSTDPAARLQQARLERLKGRPQEALALLEAVGRDPDVPVEMRAEAYARLAEIQCEQAQPEEAGRAAQAAAALLEVRRRSHAQDPRLHRLLARVFRGVGARARSVEHRAAARRTLRLPSPAEVGAPMRRRIVRALWLDDPRPAALRHLPLAV